MKKDGLEKSEDWNRIVELNVEREVEFIFILRDFLPSIDPKRGLMPFL